MKISVVGTGYVGLVTGTCFAEMGNEVTCVDVNEEKVKAMKNGKIPIYEPDLDKLFLRNIKDSRLSFTTNLKSGIKDADAIFLALPTPPGEDGAADLSYILGVADKLGTLLDKYTVIVDKSTVPVGTAQQVREHIAVNAKTDFDVVSNPEFLREGFAVSDFLKPDRIVIGTGSKRARSIMEQLYKPFVRQGNPILFMGERSAEMTKYAANSFLATKISFMNEIANLCERVGANADAVRLGIGSDERIGKRFLFPGIGYGGSCFPKDVLALQQTAAEHDYDFRILSSVQDVNARQKQVIQKKIRRFYKDGIQGKHFALWGLAFKPDTDDVREAPAIEIINFLLDNGATVSTFDPEAMANVKRMHYPKDKRVKFAKDEYTCLKGADALIVATEWAEFRSPDTEKVKQHLKEPVVFDGRNIYERGNMKKAGFYYESIGRRVVDGRA